MASIARLAALSQRGFAERVLVTTALVAVTVLVGGAASMLDAERASANANITTSPDALWWALTTVTTVGYGDRYPVTSEGRSVAAVVMTVGIAVMGTVTAAIASRVIRQESTWSRTRRPRGYGSWKRRSPGSPHC